VGILPEKGLMGRLASGSDGVVRYTSAHVEEADSELIVPADHLTIHTHPETIQEVRRILLEHLAEIRSMPLPPPIYPPLAQGVHPAGYTGQEFSAVQPAEFHSTWIGGSIPDGGPWQSSGSIPLFIPREGVVSLILPDGRSPEHQEPPRDNPAQCIPPPISGENLPSGKIFEQGIPWAVGFDPIRR